MNKEVENPIEKQDKVLEKERLQEVIHVIKNKKNKLKEKTSGLKESIIDIRKEFWDDVTVNLDELDDVYETQASLKQQAEFLAERERAHGNIDQERKTLELLEDSPYFGRIDFNENGSNDIEVIYIGKASLMDENNEEFLVYDWRAPISSLYYDYSPGPAKYNSVQDTITGEITLKRQYIIRQGELKGMFNTGLTIGDSLLQRALGGNASTMMKSIVATIQKEQNKIIRNERSNLLIVQGVAGSGKTSAALQRVAYLLYRFREELNANDLLLFSPNPLFASYINNVLPELGEQNIAQTTFLQFLRKRIEKNIKIESPFDQMEYTLTVHDDGRIENMDFKSSLKFKDLIDAYVSDLKKNGIQFRNIRFRGEILISKEEISNYFYELDPNISIPNKVELVSKWLLNEIRTYQRKEIYEDWVLDEVQLLDNEEYQNAFQYSQDKFGDEDDPIQEEAFLRKEVIKRAFAPIKRQIQRFQFVQVLATYRKLFESWNSELLPENWERITTLTIQHLNKRFLTWEDATPYLYFKGKILGNSENRSIRYLFIDEAQDYSAFQFAFIRETFPYTRMTLLGDINQGIYAYTTNENPLIPEKVESNHERITLTKSYRSTKEIVEFSKQFAPGTSIIDPFEREGKKPTLIRLENEDYLIEALTLDIEKQRRYGHETIAIICKTMEETNKIYELLKNEINLYKIHEETYSFEKGILVIPVYLAKGIEFDAVIIANASSKQYNQETDRALFYTACTRAMHNLTMISPGKPCMFIEEADKNSYKLG